MGTLTSAMDACSTGSMNRKSQRLLSCHLFMIFIFFFFIFPSATPLSFDISTFNPNSNHVSFEGNARYGSDSIELTTNQKDEAADGSWGRAIYNEELYLWDPASGNLTDFTTNFSFIINSQGNASYADGITFFLNGTRLPPDEVGGEVLGLGVGNGANSSFVAVELDTFYNPNFQDPGVDHVGIDINSMTSIRTANWSSNIQQGGLNHIFISYSSSSHNLSVLLITEFTGNTTNYTTSQSLYYQVDLKSYLPESVNIGFSGSTGQLFQINKILSWSFDSTLQRPSSPPLESPSASPSPAQKGDGMRTGFVVVLSVCGFVVVGGLGLLWHHFWKKNLLKKRISGGNKGEEEEEDGDDSDLAMDQDFEKDTGPRKFSYEELALATGNFGEGEKLGQGGFGEVYRGFLQDLNCYVAVKKVSKHSQQGMKEYASEVKIFSRLRHRNLVQLMGWCHKKGELLLVYEFLPNGSLSSCLFEGKTTLTWGVRYRIALGLASSLLYLHEEWEQCVIHRDIKSSNVMLDSDFNAKLGDFGLARFVDHAKGSQTTMIAGTMGYMAPECFMTGKASRQSDVYSYGIVALEICCGRMAIEGKAEESQVKLVDWVWGLYGMGKLVEAADARLSGDYEVQQMERLMIVGLWCAHPDAKVRPSMKQAIGVLNSESLLPLLPQKMPVPVYYDPPGLLQTSYRSSLSATSDTQLSNSSTGITDSSNFSHSSSSFSQSASLLHTR